MTSILGVYYAPWHWRDEDVDYMRRLNPAWVRIHQPSARAIYTVQQAAPNAKIMLRSWDIDDHNGDRKREMYADPKGAAYLHMNMWIKKLAELTQEAIVNGWQLDFGKCYLGLVNEPDPSFLPQVVTYTREAMHLAVALTWRLGVIVSSVGTFSKPSEGGNSWDLCKPLEQPINDGGHILIAHEYWQPEGPSFGEDAGNLAWRHRHIPLNVPILIGESGANGYIYNRHSQHDDAGWQKFMSPEQYAAQVREYIAGCDTRVQGVLLYMTDYHSAQWKAFDTLPAHETLLAIADTRPQVASPFATTQQTTHMPNISTGPQPAPFGTAYVQVRDGANLRTGPGTEFAIVGAVPQGTSLTVIGKNANKDWYHVQSDLGRVWVSATVVNATNVDSVPVVEVQPAPSQPSVPIASGIVEPRVAQAILKIESGGRTHGDDGRIIIRFEAHLFRQYLKNDGLFAQHFAYDANTPWVNQQWRRDPNGAWQPIHTGRQSDEYAAFEFAKSLNRNAAHMAISMGAPQIVGFNHARIGYPSAIDMFVAFRDAQLQTIGFINFCLSDPGLVDAMRRKDWREIARRYNGAGAVSTYAPLLEQAYKELGG